MWIADPRGKRPAGSCRGYTMIEIMVVIVLVSSMALVIERTMTTANMTQRYMSASRKAMERGHQLTYDLRQAITASRRLFFDDVVGREYLDAADLSSNPPVPWARLPLVDEAGRLGPDAPDTPMTGNLVFFVGETDAVETVADAAAGTLRNIDTYRFIAFYPHETDQVIVVEPGMKKALDLICWKSVEYPNYRQIMSVSDVTQRAAVIADLVNRHGHELAWDPAGNLTDSFYAMRSDGVISAVPSAMVKIAEDPAESRGGRLTYVKVQLARTNVESQRRRNLFAQDDPAVWQPHGFEIKVVGASRSRQVWVHIVVEVQAGMGQVAAHGSTLIVSVKDL